ncbi:MAG: hypothetical protein HQL38_19190, partial [Alphaproteobacteria bacterium]|nr:hypothetical protein [Alphaproteobacteria bacterium]
MLGKVIGVLALLWAGPAAAALEAATPEGKVTLLSAVSATGDATELPLGLRFQLAPGWKVYWRSPGDAGYPPSIDWAGSANLAKAEIAWPLPKRFAVLGLESIGYEKDVVLPLSVRPERPGEPVALKAVVDYLTCAEICVPRRVELDLALPAGPATPTPDAHLIDRFQSAVPGDGARAGLSVERVVTAGEGDGATLAVTLRADPPLASPDLFVEAPDGAMFQAPETRLEQGGRRAVLVARAVPGTLTGGLAGKAVKVTVGESGRAIEAAVTPEAGPPPMKVESPSLLAMLGAALLGGLILNLMPCVLPVLSLKVLALIGHGGAERRGVRIGFLASAAGIVLS